MKHVTEKNCDCTYCQMLDVMFGDPLLSAWEKRFVNSVIRQGGVRDYSPKQKYYIKRTFHKQRRIYLAQNTTNGIGNPDFTGNCE